MIRHFVRSLPLCAAVMVLGIVGCTPDDKAPGTAPTAAIGTPTPATAGLSPIERGKYLVENVGMCADCHTPRLEGGVLDMAHYQQGATLDFAPAHPGPWFTGYAPSIAGEARLSEAQIANLLQTGELPGNQRPRAPMPAFRMTADDATAVAAYLRSLKAATPAPTSATP